MYQNKNTELATFYQKHRHFYAKDFQEKVNRLLGNTAPTQLPTPIATLAVSSATPPGRL
jgi:hypothetical protein